jgi:hypothetical protein
VALRKEPSAKPRSATPQEQLEEFAKDLRELRGKAGLGYPEMAELSHYTMKTLASAAGGLTLPTLPVTMAYVRACDGSVPEWEDRWHRLAEALKSVDDETGPASSEAGPASSEAGRSEARPGGVADGGDHQTRDAERQARQERSEHARPRPSRVSTPQSARPEAPVQEQEPPPPPPADQVYVITSAAPRRPRR